MEPVRLDWIANFIWGIACGTVGILTVAEETLQALAMAQGKQVTTHLYGQEINAETHNGKCL